MPETTTSEAVTDWGGVAPADWARLITETETLRLTTGWGLANVWGHINRGDYTAALDCLDYVRPLALRHSLNSGQRNSADLASLSVARRTR